MSDSSEDMTLRFLVQHEQSEETFAPLTWILTKNLKPSTGLSASHQLVCNNQCVARPLDYRISAAT